MSFRERFTVGLGTALMISVSPFTLVAEDNSSMNPYFTAVSYTLPKDMLMAMGLADLQSARYSSNFVTGMGMVQYGITSWWTAGIMVEGQKIEGLPITYAGERINTFFKVFPHDDMVNLTLYGEYEHLNAAALYKMEVAGFGGENLTSPLGEARRTPVRTIEGRAIMYHDWGRTNATFNFISETGLDSKENDFGYALGIFRNPEWTGMAMEAGMDGMSGMTASSPPPLLSLRRLGYGVEMIGALGNSKHFGIYWQREQQYLGPVFTYAISRNWSAHVEPAFGLSDVSDPFVFRMGLSYSLDRLMHR